MARTSRTRPRYIDFSRKIERLVKDIAGECPLFAHVDTRRTLFCIAQARNGDREGLQAKVSPLRFEGGRKTRQFGQWLYSMPTVMRGRREVLYVLYFYLPRFQDGTFERKLHTVFHELYHISPEFNGDLRRFPGRKFVHGASQKAYDRIVDGIMETYLASADCDAATRFLRYSFDDLERRFGDVVGNSLRLPAAHRATGGDGQAQLNFDPH